MNNYKTLPFHVDSSEQFDLYKTEKGDITSVYFENYNDINIPIQYIKNIPIDYWNYQLTNYKLYDYLSVCPFVKKYFSPSLEIRNIQKDLLNDYNIQTNNCIAIYYRGTDKINETKIGDFNIYLDKLNEVLSINNATNENKTNENKMQVFIQTDSGPFLDFMKQNYPDIIYFRNNKTSYTNGGIHYESSKSENHRDAKYLLASLLIISNCKYIICSSGNVSLWSLLYRGNANNVYQFLENGFI
jgi:hypothetical protein